MKAGAISLAVATLLSGLPVVGWTQASAPAMALPAPMLEAVGKAINTHPGLQAQWHALLGASAGQDAARGPGRPQVDLSASVGREWQTRPGTATGSYTHTNGTLSVSQLLFDGGAVSAAVRQAGHEKLSRYYRLLDGTETMAFEAAVAYAELARAHELVELAKRNYVEHKLIHTQLTERETGGVTRRSDVEQALGRLALAESNLAEEVSAHHRASQVYLQVTGNLPPAQVAPLPRLLDLPKTPTDAAQAVSQALRQSPRMWTSLEAVRAGRASLDSFRTENAPRVDLRASQSFDRNLDGVPGRSRDAVIELLLRFNLYRGGAYDARVEQAAQALNAAMDRQEATCRDLRQTLTIALNDVNTQREQTQLLDQQRLAAEKVQAAYQQQFDIGQRSLLDLLDTHNEVFEANRAYTRARYAYFGAQARVLSALGHLTDSLGVSRAGLPSADDLGQDQPEVDPASLCAPEMVATVAVNTTPPPRPAALPRSYVVLLENADGTAGKVVVAGDKGTLELQRANGASALDGSSREAYAVPAEMLARDTSAAIGASPTAPMVFRLNFEKGSTRLTPQSREMIEQVFGEVRQRSAPDVSIVGHTDTLGGAAANMSLSLRRAESVARMLKPVASRIVAMDIGGQGETSLLVPTPDNRAEPRNRRVDVTVR